MVPSPMTCQMHSLRGVHGRMAGGHVTTLHRGTRKDVYTASGIKGYQGLISVHGLQKRAHFSLALEGKILGAHAYLCSEMYFAEKNYKDAYQSQLLHQYHGVASPVSQTTNGTPIEHRDLNEMREI